MERPRKTPPLPRLTEAERLCVRIAEVITRDVPHMADQLVIVKRASIVHVEPRGPTNASVIELGTALRWVGLMPDWRRVGGRETLTLTPGARPISEVFVSAPYAPGPLSVAENLARAAAIGRLAATIGRHPVVPHLAYGLTLGGADSPEARRDSMRLCIERIRAMVGVPIYQASRYPELWVLERDDGTVSSGVAQEIAAWCGHDKGMARPPIHRANWADWGLRFDRVGLGDLHRDPVSAWRAALREVGL